jgi:serine phosphatase RsbU (regulator of sigma subunit)
MSPLSHIDTPGDDALLDALYERAPVGLGFWNRELRYQRLNGALAAMYGAAVEDYLGRHVDEVPAQGGAELAEMFRGILATAQAVSGIELTRPHPSRPGVTGHWLASYYPVCGENGEVLGVGGVFLDVTDQRRDAEEANAARRRAEFLAQAGRELASSLDYETTLSNVADLLVPHLADWCSMTLLEASGALRTVALKHSDAERVAIARAMHKDHPARLSDERGAAEVIRSGQMQTMFEVTSGDAVREAEALAALDPEHLRLILGVGVKSAITAPMRGTTGVVGALTLLYAESDRRYSQDDVVFVQSLCDRIALAVENSRLKSAADTARRRAEFLAEAGHALSASVDYATTLSNVADLLVPRLADWCSMTLLESNGALRTIALKHSDPARVAIARQMHEDYPLRLSDERGAAEVIRTGRMQAMLEVSSGEEVRAAAALAALDPEHLKLILGIGVKSGMTVPLRGTTGVVGCVTVLYAESDRRYTRGDVAIVEALCDRIALAVENSRLNTEHAKIARTLQQSLLPPALPDIPGVQVAASYRAAGEQNEVGGDFYDLYESEEDVYTLFIGDVTGKGAKAAATTSLARHALRTASRRETSPVRNLRLLNEALLSSDWDANCCTAAYGRLHVSGRDGMLLTLVRAGHPPPLLLRAGGELERLQPKGTLLGAFPEVELDELHTLLHPGDLVLFYTDGATDVRARGNPLGEGFVEERLVACAGASAADCVQRVQQALVDVQNGGLDDDLALLAIKVG